MSTSFTPGKWIMTEEGEDDLVVCSERGDFICTPSGATFGEAIDNARLIASAPLLLRALNLLHGEFMSRMSLVRDADWTTEEIIAEDLARSAINQATGNA